jgi:predicted Zn-dependent protease
LAIAHERACEAELAGLLEALSMDTQFYELMRRITAAEAGTVVPKKLQVVTVARGDSGKSRKAWMLAFARIAGLATSPFPVF